MNFLKIKPWTLAFSILLFSCSQKETQPDQHGILAEEIEKSLKQNLLDTWYPKAIDTEAGGYFSNYTFDFKIKEDAQEKMIVTQARHLWANAKAYQRYPDEEHFLEGAKHGFKFLAEKMWDDEFGGFYQLVDRSGAPLLEKDPYKTAYGNSFAIFGLAAYYEATSDPEGLELAKKAFLWLEEHSHDKVHQGYFQHLHRDGSRVFRSEDTPSNSALGYKDQNSSIHLLEAFAELYPLWPDALLRERLEEVFLLVRDVITNEKGSLQLFFEEDWTPVSFREFPKEYIDEHLSLDHVSFGHDVETAFLLLEASHVLGGEHDAETWVKSKIILDHALEHGWDSDKAGFFDEGYYFKNEQTPTIVKDTKNWWAQAEGLNTLLLFAEKFPDDPNAYFSKFEKLWAYNQEYLIDHEHGDWFPGGLDKQPHLKTADKGHIWKACYHQYRSMAACIDRLQKWSKIEKL